MLQCHSGGKTENSWTSARYNMLVIAWNEDCGENEQRQVERGKGINTKTERGQSTYRRAKAQ